jgi:hypothetical protein
MISPQYLTSELHKRPQQHEQPRSQNAVKPLLIFDGHRRITRILPDGAARIQVF